jgi:hypothetical protein
MRFAGLPGCWLYGSRREVVSAGGPELAHGHDGGRDGAIGIEARQFGERSKRRCTGDRVTVWTGAVRQDRDEPKVRLPSSGQQFAPELGVELNGGVKAATPGADIDVTSFAAAKQRRERILRLTQHGGDDVVVFCHRRDGGELPGVAVETGVLGYAEQRAEPAERFVGDWAGDDGGVPAGPATVWTEEKLALGIARSAPVACSRAKQENRTHRGSLSGMPPPPAP